MFLEITPIELIFVSKILLKEIFSTFLEFQRMFLGHSSAV
jgi:hypothetical protein